jgi:hypothetical protein
MTSNPGKYFTFFGKCQIRIPTCRLAIHNDILCLLLWKGKIKNILMTGSYFLHSRKAVSFKQCSYWVLLVRIITIFSVTVLLWQLLTFNAYCCKQQCTLYCLTLCSFRAIYLLKILCFICVMCINVTNFSFLISMNSVFSITLIFSLYLTQSLTPIRNYIVLNQFQTLHSM